jgi:hypothetical protein
MTVGIGLVWSPIVIVMISTIRPGRRWLIAASGRLSSADASKLSWRPKRRGTGGAGHRTVDE